MIVGARASYLEQVAAGGCPTQAEALAAEGGPILSPDGRATAEPREAGALGGHDGQVDIDLALPAGIEGEGPPRSARSNPLPRQWSTCKHRRSGPHVVVG